MTGMLPLPDVNQHQYSKLEGFRRLVDVCKCNIPCPCTFAQAPTYGDCAGILVWHIQEGQYSDTVLDGLNVLGIGSFTGNIWAGQAKDATFGFFIDEKAKEQQREALQMIFGGKAGGFIAEFAKMIGEIRGTESAPKKLKQQTTSLIGVLRFQEKQLQRLKLCQGL